MVKLKTESNSKSKNVNQANMKNSYGSQNNILEDERFQHLVLDPRFKNLPKTRRTVKIDKRFQSMFDDEKFKIKYAVDKYGRKINKSNADDLRKYYDLEETTDDDDELEAQKKEEKAITGRLDQEEESSTDEIKEDIIIDGVRDESDTCVPEDLKTRLLDPNVDYARGEGRLLSDSSSEEESSDDEEDPMLFIDHVWGELGTEAETTNESTKRLAVCNMDWDRIRAEDLMVLFSSFLPPGGCILSVKIFPSQFGKERMAEEDKSGPIELKDLGRSEKSKIIRNKKVISHDEIIHEEDSDAEEGDDYHMEKLRQYQLNRLRYYYGVVECNSVATADKIYNECDGIEYESSATKVDLRFIPDDVTFDEDDPKDVCTELPEINSYKPRTFTTTALQQAKVNLTWDETAVERKELGDKLANGRIDEVDDKDLRKLVSYSSEEEDYDDCNRMRNKYEQDEIDCKNQIVMEINEKNLKTKNKEDMIQKYKTLLAEIDKKEQEQQKQKNKYEMEFSWNTADHKEEKEDTENNALTEKSSNLTPIEKILKKRSEKNKKRKEERKLKKMADSIGDSDEDSIPDGIDMNDPYFAEEFANNEFQVPKSSKQKTKNRKTKHIEETEEDKKKEAELSLLLQDDDNEAGKAHFNLEKILKAEKDSKKKRKKILKKAKSAFSENNRDLEDNFQINLNDDRFKAIYSSANFNIDPTDSHFKKTKGMEQLIVEKLKRRNEQGNKYEQFVDVNNKSSDEVLAKHPKRSLENKLLIKNLKRKLQN